MTSVRRLHRFATILVGLVLFVGWVVSCHAGYCSRNAEDTWYRAPPDSLPPFGAKWYRAAFVARVLDSKQAFAQKQLINAAFVPLSPAEAHALVGEKLPGSELRYVLLRALEYPERPGEFQVWEKNGVVNVTFATLGDTPPRAKRAAIVAHLQREPVDVFVSCDSAI